MANEFVAKNGLISQNNSIVTGSLTVTGGITGSLLGTASLAINSTNAVTSAVATNVTVIDTTADIGTYYPTFVSTTAGNLAIRLDSTGLTYNPANNSLSVTRVTASLFGTSSWSSNATTASFALNANIFPFTGSALITGSLGVTGLLTATQIGAGAAPSGSVRLDVRAQGSLSTDIAFRVRNSADTQNLMSITGDGRVAIGLNAQILGTTDAFKNVVIGGLAKDISSAGVTENAVALGYNAVSNNSGTAIGANTQIVGATGTALGASAYAGIDSTAIGAGARADGTSLYQSLAIGRGARASALLSGIIAVGQSSYTNALGQTLAFCVDPVGANSQTILLTNRANLIFRNSTQLTSGTHWDTTATNTLTIHSGSIPVTTVSGAFQIYAATGSLTNNTIPHFRTGNGTIVWLGDESRLFNVTASNITASNITAASLTIPSGSITLTTGSITMPNRPAFRVTGAGGGKTAVTTLSGSYLNVDYQQGGGWDNSTGTFTAPIAGLYQVNLVTRTNSNSLGTISQLIVYKNNTGGTTGTPQVMIEYGINTSMNHVGGSTISKLAVGDTLKMVVAVGEISFDQNDNFSVAYIG